MGATAFRRQQNLLYVVIKPGPSNTYDSNAIAVVVGVGNKIDTVGYIPKELTKHVHPFTYK